MSFFVHERIYRSHELWATLQDYPITICGAGAIGANLTENLVRSGFGKITVIDRDRVEEQNLSTQPYYRCDVGAQKVKILTNNLYRALGIAVEGRFEHLTAANVESLLQGSSLVIDSFDNSVSRQIVKDYCTLKHLPCLHIGLSSEYAEMIWNEGYQVPSPAQDDICDYPLARNLVLMTVAIASEVIIQAITTQSQSSYTLTFKDFAVHPWKA